MKEWCFHEGARATLQAECQRMKGKVLPGLRNSMPEPGQDKSQLGFDWRSKLRRNGELGCCRQ